MEETLLFIKAHWDTFEAVLVKQPDVWFEVKLKEAIKAHFRLRYPHLTTVDNYELIAEIMASAVLGGYKYWLACPQSMKESALIKVTTQTLDEFVKILSE
jgi:hypothetical protein